MKNFSTCSFNTLLDIQKFGSSNSAANKDMI